MAISKKVSKHHILLWIGMGMIAAAIILTLVGAFLLGPTGSYSAPTSDTGPSSNTGSSGVPGNLTEAREAFEQAVSNSYGDSNLEVEEVMEFANNYYAEVKESDPGIYAMELLIDKRSGQVYPEPGPNMMWNNKYGMMGGGMSGQGMMGPSRQGMMQPDDSGRGPMMGPGGQGMIGPGGQGMMGGGSSQARPETEMPVSPEQATQVADDYLNRVSPGTETEEPDQFYGYYTLHTLQDGEITGMLSVNGYTGQVWYHGWHGPFVAMEEEGESH
jgi:hypothetical protein